MHVEQVMIRAFAFPKPKGTHTVVDVFAPKPSEIPTIYTRVMWRITVPRV